jgi:ATP-binding cassette subfamily B protein
MKSPSFQYLLARLWHHLGQRHRRELILLMGLMLLSAFAEVVSLGAVLPFIAVLAAPDMVLQYALVADLADYWGITSPDQLVLPLTVIFCLAAIMAGAMRILVTWLSTRLTFAGGADLSIEVYRRTLYQPYHVHVARSSSEAISGITGKVGHTTLGVLLPLLTLVSSAVLLVAIMTALIVIDPVVATVATAGFGSMYGLVTWLTRRRLDRDSELIAREHTRVVKVLQEGLGGIRDVLLDGTQPVYCEVYRQADQRWRLAQGEIVWIRESPRFALEALGMVLIAALAYGISRQAGGDRRSPAGSRGARAWRAAHVAGDATDLCCLGEYCGEPRIFRRYHRAARSAPARGADKTCCCAAVPAGRYPF